MDVDEIIDRRARYARVVEGIGFGLVIALLVLVPLYVSTRFINYHHLPKLYLVAIMLFLALGCWLFESWLKAKIVWRATILDRWILLFFGITIVSALFSSFRGGSWFGRGDIFTSNIFAVGLVSFFFFIFNQYVHTIGRWRLAINALLVGGGLSALFFILKTKFAWFAWPALVGTTNTIDPAGSMFGYWTAALGVLALVWLFNSSVSPHGRVVAGLTALFTLGALAVLSFPVVWWFLIGTVVLVALPAWIFYSSRKKLALLSLGIFLLVALYGLLIGFPRAIQAVLPLELVLTPKNSGTIALQTVLDKGKNLLIGSGPGTFIIDFARYRDTIINSDSQVWSLRFVRPFSSFLALVAEGGVLVTLALALLPFIMILIMAKAWLALRREREFIEDDTPQIFLTGIDGALLRDSLLIALLWLDVTVGAIFIFYTFIGWWLWWVLLAITLRGFMLSQLMKSSVAIYEMERGLPRSPYLIAAVVMGSVLLVVAVVGAGANFASEAIYTQALQSINDPKRAEELLTKSIAIRRDNRYYNALTSAYVAQAYALSGGGTTTIQAAAALVAQAVNVAKEGVNHSPRLVESWENLAIAYEIATQFTPDAGGWALQSWQRAATLDPVSPVIQWRLGNNYRLLGQAKEAEQSYVTAIRLKPDYLDAHIALISLYEAAGKEAAAIVAYQPILSYITNADIIFDYGRLIYNRNQTGDRAVAERIFLVIIEKNPNYSNALYALAVLYEERGEKKRALEYYKRVRELNPDNEAVASKVRRLNGLLVPSTLPTSTPIIGS